MRSAKSPSSQQCAEAQPEAEIARPAAMQLEAERGEGSAAQHVTGQPHTATDTHEKDTIAEQQRGHTAVLQRQRLGHFFQRNDNQQRNQDLREDTPDRSWAGLRRIPKQVRYARHNTISFQT